ncbi:MAG TPA: DUF4350 domain-containing protein [Steroidobacteraceae bacterium]|nr:DUF4350 domain-containing protein [Steroidobacteraceae bacterium]
MKHRRLIIGGLVAIALVGLGAWFLNNTYWEEVSIPTALQGPAREDPFYAAKALVRELGGEVTESHSLARPSPDDVVFLANWSWNLGPDRRRELEEWVEAGGRLVMDNSIWLQGEVFTQWSGVDFWWPDQDDEDTPASGTARKERCPLLQRQGPPVLADEGESQGYVVCDLWDSVLTSKQRPLWLLRDGDDAKVMRVPIGKGSLTLAVASPFSWRDMLEADHAQLFVAMTQLRRGDRVHFLSEAQHPSLLGLTWQVGWPALVPALLALALLLWRSGTRFGPQLEAAAPVRRSLVEQIRGTGRFLMRRGGADALHAASLRALEAAARRAIPGFDLLEGQARTSAIARAAGVTAESLAPGLQAPTGPRSLIAALLLLEGARRRILSPTTRRTHGS